MKISSRHNLGKNEFTVAPNVTVFFLRMICIHKRVETNTEVKTAQTTKLDHKIAGDLSEKIKEQEHIKEKREITHEIKLLTAIPVTSHA